MGDQISNFGAIKTNLFIYYLSFALLKAFLKNAVLSADMAKSKLDLYKILFYKYHLP